MRDILIYFTSPVVIFAVILIFVMLFFFMNRPKEDEEEEIITTKDMLKDVNEERRNAGLYEIPEMNLDGMTDYKDSQHFNCYGQAKVTRYMVEKGYLSISEENQE